ncbi:MAG: heavy metal resistance protein CzcA [Thaumarchaeota archaeon]|nr:MAG: heavy metal resistance protein CzcA [Nitrososphaerota archaeon]TLY14387.1 MAG: heavy metal resistance protein CzcA [Nitrososphaerota archaeon]
MMIPVRVVADERERASGVPEELSKLNVRVYFSKLSVGDYVLSPEVAVERKSIPDLISSVYDSRIFIQASRIASAYAKPYLLIEGDSKEVERLTRNLKSYYGAIASVTLAYGLRVLFTANKTETAVAISELLRNVRARPVPHQMSETPPRSKSFSQQQAYLVSSLPGVGRKLAERLLRKYGTPRRVMSLTQGELSLTPGIGWKRAERIKRLLDEQFVGAAGGESQTKLE